MTEVPRGQLPRGDAQPASERAAAPAAERPLSAVTRWKFAFVRLVLWGWARCFSLSGLYWLGQFFGFCEYLVDFNRRRRIRRRVEQIFPEGLPAREVRRIVSEHFRRMRCDKMLYLVFDKIPRDKLLKRIKWHGREHLDEALARGNGAYIMLSHFGSHLVAGFIIALMGYRIAGVRDPKEAALRRYIQDRFAESFPDVQGLRIYFADTFPRAIYREFKENAIVCTALDVDRFRGEHLKTCPVRIFGQTKEFLTGTLQIALRCGAPAMQGFMISRKNYYYRWELSAPLADPATARDEPGTVSQIMQSYADNIEQHARKYPDHLMRF